MGASKASLDWHGMPLVARIAGIAGREFAPVVVVASAGQPVPAGAERVEDRRPGAGRWRGIAAGMRALAGRADAAIVTSTDAPFLHPAFLRGVAAALGDHDVAVPVAGRPGAPARRLLVARRRSRRWRPALAPRPASRPHRCSTSLTSPSSTRRRSSIPSRCAT